MFTIRAEYTDTQEVKASIKQVHEFFTDIKNFVELMPSVESIYADGQGIIHWKIRAEIPFAGAMIQNFAVELAENSEDRLEWIPTQGEQGNLLRYTADFLEKEKDVTVVRFAQIVELRRKSATDLHILAGLAGESIISSEMSKRIAQMIKIFVARAKERLES